MNSLKTENMYAIEKINLNASNMAVEWESWLSQFNIYLTASKLDTESDVRKVALLLHHLGPTFLTHLMCLQVKSNLRNL